MGTYLQIAQVVVGVTILMVWLVRANRDTNYRGGDAKTMREEFAVYGFPDRLLFPVGILKVLLALFLLSGIWYAPIVRPAATAMAFLMLVAVVSHFRVRSDSPRKALPALCILLISMSIAIYI